MLLFRRWGPTGEVESLLYEGYGLVCRMEATKTNGQYDSKTFEVRARPLEKVADLRPGMSVILKKKGKEIV